MVVSPFSSQSSRFNSRTPGGVRPVRMGAFTPWYGFNSRTPGGVRLYIHRFVSHPFLVSIHAPREGCDV